MKATKFNPSKTAAISALSDFLKTAKSVAVVDYRGLKVSQATELRKAVKKAGGEYVVAKNTLFKIASGLKDLDLKGVSAFVFSSADEVSAIKAVADFAKKNQLPTFKAGLMGTLVLTAAEVALLSSTPDQKTLLTKTVVSLKSPLYGLVYNLNWNLSRLVRTLDAVRASKGVTN